MPVGTKSIFSKCARFSAVDATLARIDSTAGRSNTMSQDRSLIFLAVSYIV